MASGLRILLCSLLVLLPRTAALQGVQFNLAKQKPVAASTVAEELEARDAVAAALNLGEDSKEDGLSLRQSSAERTAKVVAPGQSLRQSSTEDPAKVVPA